MLRLSSKRTQALYPTNILYQSRYWAQVKKTSGLETVAYNIVFSNKWSDVLVLIQRNTNNDLYACIPQGPEFSPRIDEYGPFLEEFSESLVDIFGHGIAFIRFDLPWMSPYAEEMRENGLSAFPEARLQELRMNMGTRNWKLKKAPMDMSVASSLIVNIDGSEQMILSRMKPKTRYNIGLARRKGITVQRTSMERLPAFYDLYRQTAARNGFFIHEPSHFAAMFLAQAHCRKHSEIFLLLAHHGVDLLAGAIVAVSGRVAYYLYGASADMKRNLMAPYLLHWEGMLYAREQGCTAYDMGGVSPGLDSSHPFHGLYRFKTGFGGRIELRCGSWDYPVDPGKYKANQRRTKGR
ncbi:peptidoglycan bridge formation glycyltransferase FemA/FemB family protein [Desulfonatronum sp. SC1]|uniref:lipid II:glycine glycyltransferase FemX n=1 Tax=Desulfonatronum sp. SC1 TaxID=2109626 RepID=UPI000D31D702|nr:peptidoglycan bridge formation glycyltransferase FemA/FemB family protein [Desulfonatronum sp. SC1]PTN32370.1 peptidoglycan bridge formation protein FemAB [Desulfonatronum sp. SC1]